MVYHQEVSAARARRGTVVTAGVILFVVLFNLGYVFHDVLFGDWFHAREPFARAHFNIPLIALSFLAYAILLSHLFPPYLAYYRSERPVIVGVRFGVLMGVVFDALQGGLIEYATFEMPFEVFVVDSGYHVLVEGSIAGLILGLVFGRARMDGVVALR